MHLLLRTLYWLITSRRRSPLSIWDTATVPMRARLTDIDIARHINNGMYFSLFDLGRFDLMVRAGVWDVMRKRGWSPVVQAETITFRKSVVLGQRFTQETRILGMDEKCIYVEQRVVVDGEVYVRAYIATRLLSRSGPVPNEEILAAIGAHVPADRQVPAWLHEWRERTALPSSRKPAPHAW
ncbi:4-hydroxybenzoyl-CoA thioesterase [Tersicoccus phoenicis]|uniref:4-hydroxybenzoyl-CoA thioesterase n=1 Tax=Tersicoccus phoenicis TaxID=554083 RepID=A0A1R1LB80_9MICC|nr:acyl-CoA thioesterase [Tersicoccus phoenicis]OMH24784.1 4-hydroxybenzoyl-CoA thioesterase [Tersicoccus phoenicis]